MEDESGTFAPLRLSRSALHVFIQADLADTYSKHFGRRAGFSRSRRLYKSTRKGVVAKTKAPPKGPFIDFVDGVLREYGIVQSSGALYSRAAIGAAFRAREPRRKMPRPPVRRK
jgi:hypothetical protein